MAGSVNKVILVGNLGKDPEIRRTQDGRPIANLSVATSESWRDKATGERKEKTEWHRVVIFNETLCRIAEQYLKKGAKVYLEGQLQTRKWQDQSGQDKYTTEVVLQNFNSNLTCSTGQGTAAVVTSAPPTMAATSAPPVRARARRRRPGGRGQARRHGRRDPVLTGVALLGSRRNSGSPGYEAYDERRGDRCCDPRRGWPAYSLRDRKLHIRNLGNQTSCTYRRRQILLKSPL